MGISSKLRAVKSWFDSRQTFVFLARKINPEEILFQCVTDIFCRWDRQTRTLVNVTTKK
jgi:hypothetical protein